MSGMINTVFVSDMKETLLIFRAESTERAETLCKFITEIDPPCKWVVLDNSCDLTVLAEKLVNSSVASNREQSFDV